MKKRFIATALSLGLIAVCVVPTSARFSDAQDITADISTVKYVPDDVTVTQQSFTGAGVNEVLVTWNALKGFDRFRVEYSQSASFSSGVSSVETATESAVVKNLANGTWYVRVSPVALSQSGRSLYGKVIVTSPAVSTPTKITADGCVYAQGALCEPRGVTAVGNTLMSMDGTTGVLSSTPLSGAKSASKNAALTKVGQFTASYGYHESTMVLLGARQSAFSATHHYFTVDSNSVSLPEDGIYKQDLATGQTRKVVDVERAFGVAVDESSSDRYLWHTAADAQGNYNHAIRACSTSFECTTVYEGDEWLGTLSLSKNYVWVAGNTFILRIDKRTGENEQIMRISRESLRGLQAVSDTNALVSGNVAGSRYVWNISIDAEGKRATQIVRNHNSPLFVGNGKGSSLMGMQFIDGYLFQALAGNENATVDGLWRFSGLTVSTTPL